MGTEIKKNSFKNEKRVGFRNDGIILKGSRIMYSTKLNQIKIEKSRFENITSFMTHSKEFFIKTLNAHAILALAGIY